jgi:hypothetical protein
MNKLPFNSIFSMIALGAIILFSSCEKDPDSVVPDVGVPFTLQGTYTSDVRVTSDTTWTISGRVIIEDGATLTIEPGSILKATGGLGANASCIIIAKGGKIMAEGTAAKPIIMTSVADGTKLGEIGKNNLNEQTIQGLWGGLLICGKAPASPSTGTTDNVEGIPADVTAASFGGSDPADNSGVIKYLSIRHGGSVLGAGKEINGLTLAAVGNGTVIENIEIVANLDDGIEFFGGTVNVKNAVVMYQGDDAFDVDMAYSGTMDNFVYVGGANSDHGMEIDGPEGSQNNTGAFTFKNGALKGDIAEYADFRDGAQGTIQDCYWFNFNEGADLEIDDVASSNNYKGRTLNFTGNVINPPAAKTIADFVFDKSGTTHASDFATEFAKNNSIGASKPTGFKKSAFAGWSLFSTLDVYNEF